MNGLLFITAQSADFKIINRFLLALREYSGDEGEPMDWFRVIRSRDPGELSNEEDGITKPGDFTAKEDVGENVWLGASILEVEEFVQDIADSTDSDLQAEGRAARGEPALFILLDDEGVANKSCVVAERCSDHDEDWEPFGWMKVRVPWTDVQAVWVNLEVGNMGFVEDFCD